MALSPALESVAREYGDLHTLNKLEAPVLGSIDLAVHDGGAIGIDYS